MENRIKKDFEIENLVWCRDLDTDKLDVELSVAVTLNKKRENQIPKDAQYLLFVTVNPEGVSKIEEIALGSDKTISLLSREELEAVKTYAKKHFYEEVVPGVIQSINSDMRMTRSVGNHDYEKRMDYLKGRKKLFENMSKLRGGSLDQMLSGASSRIKHRAGRKDLAERSL